MFVACLSSRTMTNALLQEKLKMISGDLRIVQNRPEAIILQIPANEITPTLKAFAGPAPPSGVSATA